MRECDRVNTWVRSVYPSQQCVDVAHELDRAVANTHLPTDHAVVRTKQRVRAW